MQNNDIEIRFEKVSYEQFSKDFRECFEEENIDEEALKCFYENIKLPKRATTGSAGYDFFLPNPIFFKTGETTKFPTGIKCKMPRFCVLQLFPRSSLGIQFGTRLPNTVGIIDSDYYNNDGNEGHIFGAFEVTHDLMLLRGDKYMQGIFLPFFVTTDDDTETEIRVGGIGSTDEGERNEN